MKKDTLPSAKTIAVVGSKPLSKASFDDRIAQTDSVVNTQSVQNGGENTPSAYLLENLFVNRMGADGQSLRLPVRQTPPFTQGRRAACGG